MTINPAGSRYVGAAVLSGDARPTAVRRRDSGSHPEFCFREPRPKLKLLRQWTIFWYDALVKGKVADHTWKA